MKSIYDFLNENVVAFNSPRANNVHKDLHQSIITNFGSRLKYHDLSVEDGNNVSVYSTDARGITKAHEKIHEHIHNFLTNRGWKRDRNHENSANTDYLRDKDVISYSKTLPSGKQRINLHTQPYYTKKKSIAYFTRIESLNNSK